MNGELLLKQFNNLPENLQVLVFGYIDFLSKSYNEVMGKEDELSPELKELLDERIANHEKNPHKAKTWEEIEKRLLNKYNHAV